MSIEPVQGRPREQRVDQDVAEATCALLGDVGYARLTIEAVAARARVGKAAIYRRWASKADLVFASAVHPLDLSPPSDTGALQGDLTALVEDIIACLASPAAAEGVPGLLGDLSHDPELANRFRTTFIEQERATVAIILERAIKRGELSEWPDPDLVHSLLLGSVFSWLFLQRKRPTRDLAVQIGDSVVRALSSPGTSLSVGNDAAASEGADRES